MKPNAFMLQEIDEMLHERAVGRRCTRHRRPVKLGVIWADGRATAFFCGTACLKTWKRKIGKMACVVRVIHVNDAERARGGRSR